MSFQFFLMAVSDTALLLPPSESVVCTTSQQSWVFIYHCTAFCSHSCVFPSATASFQTRNFSLGCSWAAVKQWGPQKRKPASSVTPWGGLQRITRRMPNQPELGESLWQGGRRRGGEKERACHLSLQDSSKVLIMCVLFIPHLCSLTISWETFQRKEVRRRQKVSF